MRKRAAPCLPAPPGGRTSALQACEPEEILKRVRLEAVTRLHAPRHLPPGDAVRGTPSPLRLRAVGRHEGTGGRQARREVRLVGQAPPPRRASPLHAFPRRFGARRGRGMEGFRFGARRGGIPPRLPLNSPILPDPLLGGGRGGGHGAAAGGGP